MGASGVPMYSRVISSTCFWASAGSVVKIAPPDACHGHGENDRPAPPRADIDRLRLATHREPKPRERTVRRALRSRRRVGQKHQRRDPQTHDGKQQPERYQTDPPHRPLSSGKPPGSRA